MADGKESPFFVGGEYLAVDSSWTVILDHVGSCTFFSLEDPSMHAINVELSIEMDKKATVTDG